MTVRPILDEAFRGNRPTASVSNFLNIIPEFNPAVGQIREWLDKVDEWADIFHWSDPEICCYALPKLAGAAKIFYDTIPHIPRQWIAWKNLLQQTFFPTRHIHRLLFEMLNYSAKSATSYYEYSFHKLGLIQNLKLNFSDKDIIQLILGGMENTQIKFAARAANILNPGQLATYL